MPPFSVESITLALLIIAFAAFTQGFSGFAFGILSMGLLAFLSDDLERVAAVITIAGMVCQGTVFLLDRRQNRVRWREALLLVLGAFVGLPIGYAFILAFGEQSVFRACLGMLLLTFAGYGLVRPRVGRGLPPWLGPPVGVLSGVLTGAFTSGGPPLVLYCYARVHDPREAKGTLQVIFLMTAAARLTVIQVGERPLDEATLLWAGLLAPAIVLATVVGYALAYRVSAGTFLHAVYALIALAGLSNLGKALL